MAAIHTTLRHGGCGAICDQILATIPDWFGIPEANADYVAEAERNPTVVAEVGAATVGLVTIVRHSPSAAEVHLMAVARSHHRQGIGSAMLLATEDHLRSDGVRFLQVKTLADTDPDPNYAETRAFYRAKGFVDLEVFPTLWDPSNPALQMIKSLG